jgi:hypothetical protein
MSDIAPDIQLVIMKKRQGIAQQENYVQQQLVTIGEAVANIRRARDNMRAGQQQIVQLKEELDQIELDHGVFSSEQALAIAEQFISLSGA